MNDTDKELWNIMTDVPKLNIPIAALCVFLNLGLSGAGTMVAGYMCQHSANKTQMWTGAL